MLLSQCCFLAARYEKTGRGLRRAFQTRDRQTHVQPFTILCAARVLKRLARWVYAYPLALCLSANRAARPCVYYTVKHLEFDSSRNNLVGSDKKYHQNLP